MQTNQFPPDRGFGFSTPPATQTQMLIAEYFRHHNACVLLTGDQASLMMLQALVISFIATITAQSSQPYGNGPNNAGGSPMYQSDAWRTNKSCGIAPQDILGPIRAFLALLEARAGVEHQKSASAQFTDTQRRTQAEFNIQATAVDELSATGKQTFDFSSNHIDPSSLLNKTGLINHTWHMVVQVENVGPKDEVTGMMKGIITAVRN